MIRVTVALKLVVVAVAAILFLTFSRLTMSLLIPEAIGILLVAFGITMRYKPASVLGLFVDLVVVALSVEIVTLTETDIWLTSVLGLLIPTCLLAWSSLLSESDDAYVLRLRTPSFAIAACSTVAISVSVPLIVMISGVVFPAFPMTMSTLAETSIVFLVLAALSLMLLRSPEEAAVHESSGESADEARGAA